MMDLTEVPDVHSRSIEVDMKSGLSPRVVLIMALRKLQSDLNLQNIRVAASDILTTAKHQE